MSSDGLSTGYSQPILVQRQDAIEQVVGNLVQHSQHLRIKKLLFSVCYGTWENEVSVLDTVSVQSLVAILLGRYSTLHQCRECLHKKASNLNRKKLYTAIANTILHYLRGVFAASEQHHASTDQKVANLSASVQTLARAERYQPVIKALSQADNLEVIKTFLGYLGQRPGNIADTASSDLLSLVQLAHRQAPTPLQLKQNLLTVTRSQTSPAKAQMVARQILRAFRPLYATGPKPVVTTPDSLTLLERELSEKCDTNQVRVLLYSILYGPYADSPLQRQILQSKSLRDLLEETFDYCTTYSDFESKLTILAHCLETSDEMNRALKAMLVSLHGYYTRNRSTR